MESRLLFEDAPKEIISQLVPFQSVNQPTLTALMITCRTLYTNCIGDKLLLDIACGKIKSAQNILENNPELIFYKGTFSDYSGYTFHGVTPLDVAFGFKHLPMCQMMLLILDKIKDGRARAFVRLSKNFPEVASSRTYDFTSLVRAVRAKNNYDEELQKFLLNFQPGNININDRCNIQVLIDAIKVSKTITEEDITFFKSGRIRFSYFWRFVVGHLERLITPYYAESICKGLTNVLNDASILCGNFEYDAYEKFYPLNARLGRDFAVIGMNYGINKGLAGASEKGMTAVCPSNGQLTSFIESLIALQQLTEAGLAKFRNELICPALKNDDDITPESSCAMS